MTRCGRCNGLHAIKSCYHDPAIMLPVRPDGWIVKKEFSKKELEFSRKELEFSTVAVFKSDFSIFLLLIKQLIQVLLLLLIISLQSMYMIRLCARI